jgi:TRAP-type mannitol/chloroaromatic compound transport system permease small subunit
MTVQRFLFAIDRVSAWSGKTFAWLIVALALVVGIEVFKRYILNAPTAWIFDATSMLYGTLFMMCGAYGLAQNAHVRGDFLYGSMKPRTQAGLDLTLYILFFIPGILALVYAGYGFAELSWRINEHSNVTANGPPVYHFKAFIPIAALSACAPALGPRVSRTSRKSMWLASSCRTANSWTRIRVAARWSMPRTSKMPPVIAAWATRAG